MKRSYFTFASMLVSFVYWMVDSIIHKYLYSEEYFEFIPSDINELWMRVLIVILLISFGIYADKHSRTVFEKEKEKEINAIFKATIQSTQHILNNLLNQMVYFKMIADDKKVFEKETIDLYDDAIKEGKELVKKLSSVEELTEENIKDAVFPKHDN